jgi:putative intracellular protease/amidase/predicted RNA-binding Zn-ribbon protein involved in translation (DUF1610 family)
MTSFMLYKNIAMNHLFVLAASLFLFAANACAQESPTGVVYVCPDCGNACDQLTFDKPGTCPHCGMELIVRPKDRGADSAKATARDTPVTVCFYLQNGVELLDFAGPMEVFADAGFKVFTVSRTKDPILAQGVLKVTPDYSIEDAPASDIVAFFGGSAGVASNDPVVIRWITDRAPSTHYIFSVCTGAFIIAKAGLLDGLTATTFHSSIDDLRQAAPQTHVLADVRFVDNGRVITTAGISAGIDGALHLVAKLKGDATARAVAQYMEYDKWVPDQGLIITGK